MGVHRIRLRAVLMALVKYHKLVWYKDSESEVHVVSGIECGEIALLREYYMVLALHAKFKSSDTSTLE